MLKITPKKENKKPSAAETDLLIPGLVMYSAAGILM
jgi:hypothetical protein